MTVKELRAQTGLSQSQFAARFQIPVRTLQQWEQEIQSPPPYVVAMIQAILEYEQKEGDRMKERDREHLDLDIAWSALTEEEQLTLHQLLAKAHTAYCNNEQKE